MAANTVLTTNFNVSPYYDDYDFNKDFYRILFKPGYAVQARELTQLQTILQEQVTRFGRHMFREGSIVLPGGFSVQTSEGFASGGSAVDYVKIKDLNTLNNTVNVNNFKNVVLTGATTGIQAIVIDVLDGVQTSTNTKTLYVRYTRASTNSALKVFQPNEVLNSSVGTAVALASSPTGFGSRFQIEEGVIFAKNHFIKFPKQSIIIERYNRNPSKIVGMLLSEEIVSSEEDTSLLDPALESSNYAAPGADRFSISPTLYTYNLTDQIDQQDFISLVRIENGIVTERNDRPEYNIIADEMAKRTFDESGNYLVGGMAVQIREHDNTGSNFGRYDNGNNQLLAVSVSAGTAYVKGYEINYETTQELVTRKGLDVASDTHIITTTMGSYVVVNEVIGMWEQNKGAVIYLYDTAQNSITDKKLATSAAAGTLVGYAKVLSLEYVDGREGYDAQYNLYLTDVQYVSGYGPGNVQSFYMPATGAKADIVGSSFVLQAQDSYLLYDTGSLSTKSVRDKDDPTTSATSFSFLKTEGIDNTVAIDTTGLLSITIPSGIETLPYGTTTLASADKREIKLVLKANTNLSLPGTVTGTVGATRLLGDLSTNFLTLNVGDKVRFSGNSLTYTVTTASANNRDLIVSPGIPALAGNTVTKVYLVGDIIDLTTKGANTGTVRSVTTTPSSLTIDLKETFSSTVAAAVTFPVARVTAREMSKVLRTNRYVKINASTLPNLTGPINLGFSDIYRIKSIRKGSGSYPTSNTGGTDVTSSFIFNNGQTDNMYDHGYIRPRSAMEATDRLLIELDYFDHTATGTGGYFSVDSYPIQDNDALFNAETNIRTENVPRYRTATGKLIDLRNVLDFRPVKNNIATAAVLPSAATENPGIAYISTYPKAAWATFKFVSQGIKIPMPSNPLTFDVQNYLGRIDLVTLDKTGSLSVVGGVPSLTPITPKFDPDKLTLSVLKIPPYPSLSPAYGNRLGRSDLSCASKASAINRFTMRDIGILQDRIENLEYYTTLNALEKAATTVTVRDEAGLDRFKNGIFVDSLKDDTLSINGKSSQWCLDPVEQSYRPIYTSESFMFDLIRSSGVVARDRMVILNYSEMQFLNQNVATSERNLERASYLFLGQLKLTPDRDIWTDTTFLADEVLTTPEFVTQQNLGGTYTKISTTWNDWYVTNRTYTVRNPAGGGIVYQGTDYSTARRTADQYNTNSSVNIAIDIDWNRTGTEYGRNNQTSFIVQNATVRDVEIVPYIRPQVIYCEASNLKPNARIWVYFDNIPVSNTCRPLTASQYNTALTTYRFGSSGPVNPGEALSQAVDANGVFISSINITDNLVTASLPAALGNLPAEGTPIFVGLDGKCFFSYRIQQGQFRTGERKMIIGDSRVIISESGVSLDDPSESITTGASATFTAAGQKMIKQRTVIKIPTVQNVTKPVDEQRRTFDSETVPRDPPPPPPFPWWLFMGSCSAYSFLAKTPNNEEGMFLTSATIFVGRKSTSTSRGIWFEVREIDSGGGITRNQVPGSEKHFENIEIPISTNGIDNGLTITFNHPLFLFNDTQYAFVVHSDAADPDTYIWTAKLGEVDVNTGARRTSRPYTGTYYTTNNNMNWDMEPDVDMTIRLRRAEFVRNSLGTATLGNKPIDKLRLVSMSKEFTPALGDMFHIPDRLVLDSTTNIVPGDIIKKLSGATVVAQGTVASVSGKVVTLTGFTNFSTGTVNVFNSANTAKFTRVLENIQVAFGTLTSVYTLPGESGTIAEFSSASGGFVVGQVIRSISDSTFYATINELLNFDYSTATYDPDVIKFNGTSVSYQIESTSKSDFTRNTKAMTPGEQLNYLNERTVLSISNERLRGVNRSMNVHISMTTTSNVISPIINIDGTNAVATDNIISSDYTNETSPDGGNMLNKYISKTVTLADDQDAEDLRIYLSAFRPRGTDIKVWVKFKHREDSTSFEDRPWIELEKLTGEFNFSTISETSRNDWKEYQYKIPGANMTGTGGAIAYTSSTGAIFEGYKQFSIKIGLLLDPGVTDTAIVPRVADIRCIALQM